MADLNAIADQLSSLTVMEAADLAKLLEQKWGVSAAAPVAVAAGGAVGGGRRRRRRRRPTSTSSCSPRATRRSR